MEGTAKSPARIEKSERVQLTLFEADEPPALKELRATDVDTLSPLEALTMLSRWKRELER